MFALDARREDGSTLRSHYQAAERQTGRTPERLLIDPIPEWAAWHVTAWSSLSSGRSSSGMGLTPLTWLDFQAWSNMRRMPLTDQDIHIIRHIDNLWIGSVSDQMDKNAKSKSKSDSPKSGRP